MTKVKFLVIYQTSGYEVEEGHLKAMESVTAEAPFSTSVVFGDNEMWWTFSLK